MAARRSIPSGVLAAAALLPPLIWLAPAFLAGQAPTYRDQGDFFFPLKIYTVRRLLSGDIPLWNPLSGGGEPWLANGQSGVFYPPTLLFAIPLPALAAALYLLLHFAIAAWGSWRFFKREAVSDAGALLGTAALLGGGFALSLSAYWNHFAAWAYLPGIAAAARSGLGSRRAVAGLAALLGLQAMAGSPEMSLAGLAVAAVFAWRARTPADGWRRPTLAARIRSATAAALLGFCLAGWTLVPMAELALVSSRRAPLPAAERERGSAGLAAAASSLGSERAPGHDYLASFLFGPLALAAALALLLEKERRRLVLTLAGLAAAGVLLSSAGPPGTYLRALPPLDRLRFPVKALSLTFLSLSFAAGLGADSVRFVQGRARALCAAALCIAGGAILLLFRPGRQAAFACAVGLAALLALALAAVTGRPLPRARAFLAGLAAAALVAFFAFAGRGIVRFAPESEIARGPETSPFLARISGRVLTPPMDRLASWVLRDARYDAATLERQRRALLGYTNLIAGVTTVRTAAPLPTLGAETIAASIDQAPDPVRFAGSAAARVFWTPFAPGEMGSRKVGEFFRAPINPFRPRLSFVSDWRIEADPTAAWKGSAGRDWSREVALDSDPNLPAAGKRSYVVARIAKESAERVEAQVTADAPGILVLADLFYPGWQAEVDGRPARILRADGFFRAVALPAGEHTVVFRYRPLSFAVGSALSGLSLALLLAMAWRG